MWNPKPIWDRWRELTRLCVALDAASDEFVRSRSSDRGNGSEIAISWRGKSDFCAPLDEVLELLEGKDHIGRTLLIHSYALVEAFALDLLHHLKGIRVIKDQPESIVSSGIESWASYTLIIVSLPWTKIRGGKLGLMEVSFARNAIVHGLTHYSQVETKRCSTAEVAPAWKSGDPIPLTLHDTLEMRYRIQCFMRVVCQAETKCRG